MPCHVEQSETSLAIGLASSLKQIIRDLRSAQELQEECVSMPKVPDASEDHRHVALVRGGNDFLIAD